MCAVCSFHLVYSYCYVQKQCDILLATHVYCRRKLLTTEKVLRIKFINN